jgi:hypothetical protein
LPRVGATLGEVVRSFQHDLNRLLAKTLTEARLVPFSVRGGEAMQLAFRQRRSPVEARFRTRFGPMELFLGQLCGGEPTADRGVRLVTRGYRYTLTPAGDEEPAIRWEYQRDYPTERDRWCRHHVQGLGSLPLGGGNVPLNALHLPTGYVPIEEVIRFCIVDLGAPPLSAEWHEELKRSYESFKEEVRD